MCKQKHISRCNRFSDGRNFSLLSYKIMKWEDKDMDTLVYHKHPSQTRPGFANLANSPFLKLGIRKWWDAWIL